MKISELLNKNNLIDEIKKQKIKESIPFFSLKKNIVGESSYSKINKISKYLKNLPEKVVKHKYKTAAVIKNVRGECSTLEDILD